MTTARTLAALGAVAVGREVAWSVASPVTNRVADAYDAYDAIGRVGGSARALRYGAAGLYDAKAVSSGTWFHGPSDRQAALAQLGADWLAFQHDVASTDPQVLDEDFIRIDVAPALAGWLDFLGKIQATPVALYTVEWSALEGWWQRLVNLRIAARARGAHFDSAEPAPLPKTIFQRGADGTGSQLDTWLTFGKVVVLGAIAVSGLVGLYTIARDVRRAWNGEPVQQLPGEVHVDAVVDGEHEPEPERESDRDQETA